MTLVSGPPPAQSGGAKGLCEEGSENTRTTKRKRTTISTRSDLFLNTSSKVVVPFMQGCMSRLLCKLREKTFRDQSITQNWKNAFSHRHKSVIDMLVKHTEIITSRLPIIIKSSKMQSPRVLSTVAS